MIRSFKCSETSRLFQRGRSQKLPPDMLRIAYRKLLMLDAAVRLDDLRIPPGNRLEALRGDRVGQMSIRINDRWRLCFVWNNGSAELVEIVDYHD